MSHSARSAWIEMRKNSVKPLFLSRSHSARSAWIEIDKSTGELVEKDCRTPHGVRGLK